MIVVGVDPGARATGVVVIDLKPRTQLSSVAPGSPRLFHSTTVLRDKGEPMMQPSLGHLGDVGAVLRDAIRRFDPDLLAVEGLTKPGGFAKGKRAPIDPGPLVASGIVLGSILARSYGVDCVVVPPGANGSQPISYYPRELRPARGNGAGRDNLRHERSAYDVALRGPTCRVSAARRASVYA